MEVQDVIAQARDTMTVKRVFGEPYEKDGVTIIPAARSRSSRWPLRCWPAAATAAGPSTTPT